MRLLVFLHGTVLMHAGAVGRTRDEREQGAELAYLSSHRDPAHVAHDARVLREHGFPPGHVLARGPGEELRRRRGARAARRRRR